MIYAVGYQTTKLPHGFKGVEAPARLKHASKYRILAAHRAT